MLRMEQLSFICCVILINFCMLFNIHIESIHYLPGKFAGACLGVFLLGIFTEFLSYLRRQVRLHVKSLPPPPQIFIMCILYAVQLMFGYFCMLIAMTYQVSFIFCMRSRWF